MDMKEAIAELRQSQTLEWILAAVLCIANFLNGSKVSNVVIQDHSLAVSQCCVV